MTNKLNELYEKGKLDLDFQKLLKKQGENYKPRFWWSTEKKTIFALMYYGYCLDKKKFKSRAKKEKKIYTILI